MNGSRSARLQAVRHAMTALLLSGCVHEPLGPLEPGTWGGQGVGLVVGIGGLGQFEFDCAHGATRAPLHPYEGRFAVAGVYALEHGGPVGETEPPDERDATYEGDVDATTLVLSVRLEADGTRIGPFTLRRDQAPTLHKCQ
jgi:hypothetical protein